MFIILLGIGKWMMWADLSLRRNGHGQTINEWREIARREFAEKVNEHVEREVAEAAPVVAEGIEKAAGAMDGFSRKESASLARLLPQATT